MESTVNVNLVHVTTSNHKVHHALNSENGRSPVFCGSERFGTYRNGSTTSRPIDCSKCKVSARCAVCNEQEATR